MSRFRLLAYRESRVDTFPLEEGRARWVVGRSGECDIRLADPTVSRQHLVVTRTDDNFEFEDRGSNPVLLNGTRQSRGTLAPGIPLLVGSTILYLDRAARDATVQLAEAATSGETGVRRYLDPAGHPAQPAIPASASLQATEWVAAILRAEQEGTTRAEVAAGLLDTCMNWLGFARGVIGATTTGADVEVIASRSRDGTAVVSVPRGVMQELRVRGRPFLQPVTNADGRRDAHLAVPLGEPVSGVLVLSGPDARTHLDDDLLRAAATLGEAIWTRIREHDERTLLRQQFERLSTREDPAAAGLAASARLVATCAEAEAAASQTLPVYLAGEDGTEKEELARRIHALSERAAQPFVPFYASLVTPDRIEEELFGAASTLAVSRGSRTLLRAQGGTLFLDQPEQMPARVQDRLAQVLATRSLPLGDGQVVPIDVRVIAASGEARADDTGEARPLRPTLAEQVSAIRIEIPPLRACPDDAVALALLFLTRMPPAPDGLPLTLSERSRELLTTSTWPGNVRQLRRALEVAAARAGSRPIEPRDFPDEVRNRDTAASGLVSLVEMERNYITRVLAATGGVKRRAAEILGIAASTLYDKLRRFEEQG